MYYNGGMNSTTTNTTKTDQISITPGQDTSAHAKDLRQNVSAEVAKITPNAPDITPSSEVPVEDTFIENIQETISGGSTDPSRNFLKKAMDRLSKITHRQNPNSTVTLGEEK